MNTIGNISAIATLILFVLYFIGRIWTLFKDSKYPNLNIFVDIEHTIEEYDDFDINLQGTEVIIAKYDQNISWFKISEVTWNKDFTSYCVSKELGKVERISANTKITICSYVPEGIPHLVIQFELESGIQGEVLIGYDGRQNGNGVATSNIQLKRPLKAWMYYLVR